MLQIYEKRADNVVQKRVFLIFLGLLLMQTLAFAQSDSKITIQQKDITVVDVDHYGNQYPRKIQNVTQLVVDEELAERLSLKPGDLVIRFKNIRVASEKVQETVVVTYVYIPAEAAEVLEIVKKRPEELIITLAEEVLGRECDEVKQTFSGTIMPDEVADLFKVPHGTAALKIIRNYMDVRGRTIVASESFHTADRFSFSVAVKKKKY